LNTTELNKPSEAEKEAIWRQLADQGFSLIPLYGKNPIEKEWQQWCTVRKTFEMPQAGQNMGITCGPASVYLYWTSTMPINLWPGRKETQSQRCPLHGNMKLDRGGHTISTAILQTAMNTETEVLSLMVSTFEVTAVKW
jgi:hypothetical protein